MLTKVRIVNWYPVNWPDTATCDALTAAGFDIDSSDEGTIEVSQEVDVEHDGTFADYEDKTWALTGVGRVFDAAGVAGFNTDVAIYTVTDLSGEFEEFEWGC